MDFLSRFVKNLSDNLFGTKAVPSVSQVSSDKIIPTEEKISDNGTNETVCENRHSDFPELKMTFSEAQRAGFQFRFIKTRSRHTRKAVIITSIHIKSDKTVIPSYIDGYPVTVIADDCKFLIKEIKSTSLYLPDTLTVIGSSAFGYKNRKKNIRTITPTLTYIRFPENDRLKIMDYAFYYQDKLKELHFGNYVYIGKNAFEYCRNLERVSFKKCLISYKAFYSCKSLTDVSWNDVISCGNNAFGYTPFIKSREFLIMGNTLVKYNGSSENVMIPRNTERISENAVSSFNIKRVVLPPSVKHIETRAFASCTDMEYIDLSNVSYIGHAAFQDCKNLSPHIKINDKAVINGNPFHYCDTITKACMTDDGVVINDQLISFRPNYIYNVWKIAEGIRYLSTDNFYHQPENENCTVVIPDSVKCIEDVISLFKNRNIVIKNPDCQIGCAVNDDHLESIYFPINSSLCFMYCTRGKGIRIFFETSENNYSCFIIRSPKPMTDEKTDENLLQMYSRIFKPYFNVYSYDEEILSSPLSMRTKLEAAYCRITGGFRLSEMHRKMYMEYVTVHRKKGLEYALKSGDEGQIKFFRGLF